MKNRSYLVFAISGAFAGMFLLMLARAIPLLLVFGVGPVIVGSSVLAVVTQDVPVGKVRAIAAVLLSVPAYVAAFACFAATASFIQSHGGRPSTLLSDLGPDIVLGLIAAVVVAGILLELLAFLISGRWSTTAAVGLVCGGIGSVACAYIAKVVYFRLAGPPEGVAQLLVFFGPLFVVGGGITAMIIGEQIRGSIRPTALST
jgi:hypothetical protein